MGNEQSLALAIGTLMPLIIAVVVQSHWSARVKELIAFGSCLLGAGATAYVAGELALGHASAAALSTDLLLVMAATALMYQKFWKPTGIAPWIERLTDLATILGAIPRVQVSVSRPAAAVASVEPPAAPAAASGDRTQPVPSMAPVQTP